MFIYLIEIMVLNEEYKLNLCVILRILYYVLSLRSKFS
jgi:hypothetical protein